MPEIVIHVQIFAAPLVNLAFLFLVAVAAYGLYQVVKGLIP